MQWLWKGTELCYRGHWQNSAAPLAAGPVTRVEFIDCLWLHKGEPASEGVCTFTDVPENHSYILALAWTEQNEAAFPYKDGTFEPDELITVGAAREFLDNFAKVFGTTAFPVRFPSLTVNSTSVPPSACTTARASP